MSKDTFELNKLCPICTNPVSDLPKNKKFCCSNCKQKDKYNRLVRGNRESLREYYNNLYIKKVCGLKRQSKFSCNPEITKEKKKTSRRLRYKNDPSSFLAYCAKRRAVKKQAIPKWADLDAIEQVYIEAHYFNMHVDHIYPLVSDIVCGLHVWENLQLLSKEDNSKKSNKVPSDEYVRGLY